MKHLHYGAPHYLSLLIFLQSRELRIVVQKEGTQNQCKNAFAFHNSVGRTVRISQRSLTCFCFVFAESKGSRVRDYADSKEPRKEGGRAPFRSRGSGENHYLKFRGLTYICVLAPDEVIGRDGIFGEKGPNYFEPDICCIACSMSK